MGPRRQRRPGFVLAMLAICFPVLIASLGLGADLGRMYTVKTELQAFADAAALAAAYELDGSAAGIAGATAVAASGPAAGDAGNRCYFGTRPVTEVAVAFSRDFGGTYEAAPLSPDGYRFVQVRASATIPLYFLPVLPGVTSSQALRAEAVAGQAREPVLGEGLAPFSPDAHDPGSPEFGFVRGQRYTLKWPPPGHRDDKKNTCPGDLGFLPAGGSSERGYIDVGQGNGSSSLHDAIVDNRFELANPIGRDSPLTMVTGNKHVGPAIEERFGQDTDGSSTSYADYHGNGRRVILVAVNNHGDPPVSVGLAAFFLPPDACGTKNTSPCCAEYIGPAVLGGRRAAAGTPGVYRVKLFR